MSTRQFEELNKIRNDKSRRAVALAMNNRWEGAVALNRSILNEFPKDLEAFNRLGKALSELGHNRAAKEAFKSALNLSPNNSIAKKNLARLQKWPDDEVPRSRTIKGKRSGRNSQAFIEESGKTGTTSLINLSKPNVMPKLAPGDSVILHVQGKRLMITDTDAIGVGQVEPKMANKLTRLINGGNKYEATVTSAEDDELVIIIREVYCDPSQINEISFPARNSSKSHGYIPNTTLGMGLGATTDGSRDTVSVKDWSSDDTEPGDDEAFTPVLHRIINPSQDDGEDEF